MFKHIHNETVSHWLFFRHNNDNRFKIQSHAERNRTMKKIIVLTLVFALLAVTAIPALAAGGTQSRNGRGSGNEYGPTRRW